MELIFLVLSGICVLLGYRLHDKALIGVGLGFAGMAAMPSAQGVDTLFLWCAILLSLLLISLPGSNSKVVSCLPSPIDQPYAVGHYIACQPLTNGSDRGQGELSTF